jgi:hypothetical protein
MNKREMIITIGKDGGVNIKVQVPGADWDFSKFLEEELGTVLARERTAEFFQESEKRGVQVNVGGDD